jgi:hypothetical protein
MRHSTFYLPSFLVLAVVLLASPAFASIQSMAVDEILYQPPNSASAIVNSGTVRMNMISESSMWFLLVELTNTSTQAPILDDAAAVLTGVGFQLPSGFSISATKGSNTISTFLIDGTNASTLIPASDPAISNDNWGFGDGLGGHFEGPGVLAYNTVISTHTSDVDALTLIGTAATNANIDTFDYSIKSAAAGQGPGGREPYYEDHLTFKVKLDTPSIFDVDTTLSLIDDGNIALAFGSPDSTRFPPPGDPPGTPEPASLAVWSLLVGVAAFLSSRTK